jgi:hypothetical protein
VRKNSKGREFARLATLDATEKDCGGKTQRQQFRAPRSSRRKIKAHWVTTAKAETSRRWLHSAQKQRGFGQNCKGRNLARLAPHCIAPNARTAMLRLAFVTITLAGSRLDKKIGESHYRSEQIR